jgi:XTP/dITP diphosphohydrolase
MSQGPSGTLRPADGASRPVRPDRIVVATRNVGKMREIRACLADLPIELTSLAELPEMLELDEPFDTFLENAAHKARLVAKATGLWALADDSGREVDALAGWPGPWSSRAAGEGASDADRIALLLERLAGVPAASRTARFVCALALASPSGEVWEWEGRCEGVVAEEPRGCGGFGYDPVFYVPGEGKTMAELPAERKNEISHRAAALRRMREALCEGLAR